MAVKKKIKLSIPIIFSFLAEASRYKVAHGGRGSAKSWSFADALLIRAVNRKTRILCAREIQGSIKDSVHKLLSDRIEALGMRDLFHITENSIKGVNGSEFLFKGLLRNINEIKSTEGIDIVWVEEAQNVSSKSWEILTATIRKANSEIWVTFNPVFEDDDTYQRFVVNTPDNAVVKEVNYWDNPYFPDVLRKEMEQDRERDYQLYKQKWCGKPVGLGGRVWPAFDKKIHVREFSLEEIKKKGNCFCSVDPHSKYYPAVLFYTVLPKNDRKHWPEDFYIHVYNEYPNHDDLDGFYHDLRKKLKYEGTLSQLSTNIYTREGQAEGLKVKSRFIDTRYAKGAGGKTLTTAGLVETWAKEEHGSMLFELPPEKKIDVQREIIRNDMDYNKLMPISQFNEPTFSVSPLCKNLISSLTNHRMEEESEKESEKYKDFSDALRIGYAGLTDFIYRDPEEPATMNRHNAMMGGGGFFG